MSAPAVERRFGPYGGRYVPETLIPALDELEREWLAARSDPSSRAVASAISEPVQPSTSKRAPTWSW